MGEDITVTSVEGRPIDPQVPGGAADMDASVAALLARHDQTRTDGKVPWPPTWAMYGEMWAERDTAIAAGEKLAEALRDALLPLRYAGSRAMAQEARRILADALAAWETDR